MEKAREERELSGCFVKALKAAQWDLLAKKIFYKVTSVRVFFGTLLPYHRKFNCDSKLSITLSNRIDLDHLVIIGR